ncbi:IS110 family transposase [Microvirga arabica]|uniref:IS110 family transposase n=1 Tax=Microvirga arabica TaxID=1128671 RepID=A0ABV6Y374_9HYPH
MEQYAGIDVSLELSSVCVVDATGKIRRELKVPSEPDALVRFVQPLEPAPVRIGLEAGPLSQWLYADLLDGGFDVVLLETRHVKAALSAMPVKTDRKDARGIAQMVHLGWYRPVHCKTLAAQEIRALLTARKQLQAKLLDLELCLCGILRGFGLKLGVVTRYGFEARVRELIDGHPMLEQVTGPMLQARDAPRAQFNVLHKQMLAAARQDTVCHWLMTVLGVGPQVALTFKSAVDDPAWFTRSKTVGAHFGLTPKKPQSGETDVTGSITRASDTMVRTALYEATNVMLSHATRFSVLKRWAVDVARRRGLQRAKVPLARKLATFLHRIWVDGTTFRWSKEATMAA